MQAIVLGALQGVAEFLPISSSGHLVLAEHVLQLQIAPADMQVLNVLLHAGTLLALLIAYAPVWKSLLLAPLKRDTSNLRRLVLIIVATIPGACVGVLFEDWIALQFQSLLYVAIAFACTGVILLVGEYGREAPKKTLLQKLLHPMSGEPRKLTTRSAFFIGVTQACALIPGISRSGITISAGRLLGLERKDALDFSFLMATPIIGGATLVSLFSLTSGTVALPPVPVVALAVAVSFVTSLLSIMFLRSFVVRRSLGWFSPYLFLVSAITILLYLQ